MFYDNYAAKINVCIILNNGHKIVWKGLVKKEDNCFY